MFRTDPHAANPLETYTPPSIDHLGTAAMYLEHAGRLPSSREKNTLATHFQTATDLYIGGPDWSGSRLGERLDTMYDSTHDLLKVSSGERTKKLVKILDAHFDTLLQEDESQAIGKVPEKPSKIFKEVKIQVDAEALKHLSAELKNLASENKKGGQGATPGVVVRPETKQYPSRNNRKHIRARGLAVLAASAVVVPTGFQNAKDGVLDIQGLPAPANIQIVIPGIGTRTTPIEDLRGFKGNVGIVNNEKQYNESHHIKNGVQPNVTLLPNPGDLGDIVLWAAVFIEGVFFGSLGLSEAVKPY